MSNSGPGKTPSPGNSSVGGGGLSGGSVRHRRSQVSQLPPNARIIGSRGEEHPDRDEDVETPHDSNASDSYVSLMSFISWNRAKFGNFVVHWVIRKIHDRKIDGAWITYTQVPKKVVKQMWGCFKGPGGIFGIGSGDIHFLVTGKTIVQVQEIRTQIEVFQREREEMQRRQTLVEEQMTEIMRQIRNNPGNPPNNS